MTETTDFWYDFERVNRFILDTLRDPASKENTQAAAYALLATLQGRDILKDMGVARKCGKRPRYRPSDFTIDKPAMGIILQWRSGGIGYVKARKEFMLITSLSQRKAEELMRDLRPLAEQTIKLLDLFYAQATDTQPPDRKF